MKKVYVTRHLAPQAMQQLRKHFDLATPRHDQSLSQRGIIRGMRGREGLISMLSDSIDRATITSNTSLRVIANYAVGYNNIDLEAASERKIYVTNTPDILTETSADLAWALIMSVSRRIVEADSLIRSGQWRGWAPTQLLGSDIWGKTLGVIGMGRIGQAVAMRARGFQMRLLYFGRHRISSRMERTLKAEYVPLRKLLNYSDYVSLHVPFTPQTHHLIGPRELEWMKPTAYLINTSRGRVVDERSLVIALRKKQIAGAGLDVFEHEPKISPGLLKLKNTILLPHIASASSETRIRMGEIVFRSLLAVFEGHPPPNWVNPF